MFFYFENILLPQSVNSMGLPKATAEKEKRRRRADGTIFTIFATIGVKFVSKSKIDYLNQSASVKLIRILMI